MFNILYKYLILNKQVNIPGIGHFQVEQLPTRLDSAARLIHSPLPTIKFSDAASTADKRFFQFVSRELNIQEWETIRRFHDFSFKLKSDVNTFKSIELPGMGLLMKNHLGELSFEPANVLSDYFPDVSTANNLHPHPAMNPIEGESVTTGFTVEENPAEAAVLKKDRWWIAAIVMGVLGIAAIAYYYYINSPE